MPGARAPLGPKASATLYPARQGGVPYIMLSLGAVEEVLAGVAPESANATQTALLQLLASTRQGLAYGALQTLPKVPAGALVLPTVGAGAPRAPVPAPAPGLAPAPAPAAHGPPLAAASPPSQSPPNSAPPLLPDAESAGVPGSSACAPAVSVAGGSAGGGSDGSNVGGGGSGAGGSATASLGADVAAAVDGDDASGDVGAVGDVLTGGAVPEGALGTGQRGGGFVPYETSRTYKGGLRCLVSCRFVLNHPCRVVSCRVSWRYGNGVANEARCRCCVRVL
jgi:hypothetical protein